MKTYEYALLYGMLSSFVIFSASLAHGNTCTRDEIYILVKKIGYWKYGHTFVPTFSCLRQHPHMAAGLLIKELRPIREKEILSSEVNQHENAMHIIWTLRALYYLTGADIEIPLSSAKIGAMSTRRKHFLMIDTKQSMQFFGVWMSRDALYIAPLRVQKLIIKRWISWYRRCGRVFRYMPTRNPYIRLRWYFG